MEKATIRQKITVKAEVKYCQPGIGMGIAFIDLNDEQRAKIRELVESIARKSDSYHGH